LLPRPLRSALPHSAVLRVTRISGRSSLADGAVLSCPHPDSCCLESLLSSSSRLSWAAHDARGIHARSRNAIAHPSACTADLTAISGFVSLDVFPCITRRTAGLVAHDVSLFSIAFSSRFCCKRSQRLANSALHHTPFLALEFQSA
jgi:hypothetical protein